MEDHWATAELTAGLTEKKTYIIHFIYLFIIISIIIMLLLFYFLLPPS